MPVPDDPLRDCPGRDPCKTDAACQLVFDRVVISHVLKIATRVMWELVPTFTDPGPLQFQLQFGTTNNPDADDWVDVGLPVTDQYCAYDYEQRVWGKMNFAFYRVVLTTTLGVYYSPPMGGMGVLDRREWRMARERVRIKKQAFRIGNLGQRGYLLKRRWTGEPCPRCLDYQTQEVRDPACPVCYGTGFRCGYFYPVSCVWAELSPRERRTYIEGQARGTIDDIVTPAVMLMIDLMAEDDVWIAAKTDDRYYVHKIKHLEEMKGVPIIAEVELRLIAFSSVIYSIAIPQELQELEM